MKLGHLSLTLALACCLPACKKEEPAATPAPAKAPAPAKDPGAAKPPEPAVVGDVKLTYAGAKVGDKRTKTQDMSMAMTIEVQAGQPVEMTSKKHKVTELEVLEVDGTIPSRAKLTYRESSDSQAMGGKAKEKTDPFAGKTYVVAREGDKVNVYLEDGKTAPPAAELDAVGKDQKRFGRAGGDAIDKLLSSKTWKVGVRVELTADEIVQIRETLGGDDTSLLAMSFTLRGVEGNVASFDMSLALAIERPDGAMKMTLEGTAKVDITTAEPLELVSKGPIEGKMKGATVSGTMEMRIVNAR